MDIKQYGKREKRLVEQMGMASMWDINKWGIAIIDKHGIVAAEVILEDLQRHDTDIETFHI